VVSNGEALLVPVTLSLFEAWCDLKFRTTSGNVGGTDGYAGSYS